MDFGDCPSGSELVSRLIQGREIHLWQRHLDRRWQSLERRVGAKEWRRAMEFRQESDRRRFLLRYRHLREVLGRYLGISPGLVPLVAARHHPPRLASGPMAADMHISLSSSADHAAIAVAWRRRVGIDIEVIRPDAVDAAVARQFFSPAEIAALMMSPNRRRVSVFFQIWTRKEAFIKAFGKGLARDLSSFDVLCPDRQQKEQNWAIIRDRACEDDTRWLVRDFPNLAGTALACCAEGDDWSIIGIGDCP